MKIKQQPSERAVVVRVQGTSKEQVINYLNRLASMTPEISRRVYQRRAQWWGYGTYANE